ncbi:hypothetical protein HPB52_007831 [Rhipicephalus sanguineus]|uniref:Uncharacterized protein n=1 Tax=Rhipicephalus sanguineus TaxID=34632 RepID=A0A9D4QAL9_RHISA|nr:hypothetical protein HPB52_007831 [Rhipicephalus sanguineus]
MVPACFLLDVTEKGLGALWWDFAGPNLEPCARLWSLPPRTSRRGCRSGGKSVTTAVHGEPLAFDEQTDNWEAYQSRLQSYFKAQDITDCREAQGGFFAVLNPSAEDLLAAHQPNYRV